MNLDFAIIFTAGMLATFNPCGFAMLPAYLGAFVTGDRGGNSNSLVRAISFSTAMATGLVLTFGAFSFLVAPLSGSIEQYLPYVTYVMAAVLAIIGILMLFGIGIGLTRLFRPSIAPNRSFISQVGYGITFALASLSCTIGPFLAVIATSLNADSWFGVTVSMAGYGVGMSTTVLVLALITASGNKWLLGRIRSGSRLIEKTIGLVLVLVAVYLANYATYELQQFEGSNPNNWIVDGALAMQVLIVRSVSSAGYLIVLGVAIGLSLAVFFLQRLKRSEKQKRKITNIED